MKSYLLAASLLLALFAAAPALAAIGDQSMDPAANNGTDQSADDSSTKAQAPPSPTPGSKPAAAPVADATTDTRNLDPTAALFDAITRGDLAAARDAITRGADLNARNVLGQKPVDASVDLGQNDITFALLAQRPLVASLPDNATPVAPTPTPGGKGKSKARGEANPVKEVAVSKPVAVRGQPAPGVGFLGY